MPADWGCTVMLSEMHISDGSDETDKYHWTNCCFIRACQAFNLAISSSSPAKLYEGSGACRLVGDSSDTPAIDGSEACRATTFSNSFSADSAFGDCTPCSAEEYVHSMTGDDHCQPCDRSEYGALIKECIPLWGHTSCATGQVGPCSIKGQPIPRHGLRACP